MQHILGLITDQAITAEQARDTLYRLCERQHEANDELVLDGDLIRLGAAGQYDCDPGGYGRRRCAAMDRAIRA